MSLEGRLTNADMSLFLRIRCLPHLGTVDRLLAMSSRVTDRGRGWQLLSAAGVLLDRRRRHDWVVAALALLVSEELTVRIKHRLPRRRPQAERLPPLAATPSPLSFPSSHTANAIVAARTLSRVAPEPLLWGFAAVTAVSRCYLGVHYPSDVIAGAALGELVGRTAVGVRDHCMCAP